MAKKTRTLTQRLVLWNIAGFVLAATITLFIFVTHNRNYLNQRLDRELETKLWEIKGLAETPLDRELFFSEIDHHARAMGLDHIFYRLLDESGEIVVTSDLSHWQGFPFEAIPARAVKADLPTWTMLKSENGLLGARILVIRLPGGEIVQTGLSTQNRDRQNIRSTLVITGSMLLVSLLGSLFTWLIATRTLRGMKRISENLTHITREGAFHRRVALPTGSTETDELAGTLNSLFLKIQELMAGMEQVLGDIAHDMRTPVTRIRGYAESLLSEHDVTPREEEWAGYTIAESDRILGLVNTILDINAAESIGVDSHKDIVDLVPLIKEGLDLFQFMVEDKQIEHHASIVPETAPVKGDKSQLQRVISNLMDNAIKYTPEGGQILVRLEAKGANFRLQIEDTGIGVAPEEAELIFKRFYRGDKSRTLPGNGLGLTFCRAVISATGGEIKLVAKQGPGSIFEVVLPLA